MDRINRNRYRLVEWQTWQYWQRPPDPNALRLHLGSGHLHYQAGMLNIDAFVKEEGTLNYDIRNLPYAPGTVDEITCHHVLEHIPYHHLISTLQYWASLLKPGGTLDIGMPDLDSTFNDWTHKWSEEEKWRQGSGGGLQVVYGIPAEPGMAHVGGVSMTRLIDILETLGFTIIESFLYNANDTCTAVWVYARKGRARVIPSALESDVVMGTFTHRAEPYLPKLMNSVKAFLPHIQFEVVLNDASINTNMLLLTERFRATGKRFWLYLDDDIQFLNTNTIHDSVTAMLRYDWAIAGVYSTFIPEAVGLPYQALTSAVEAIYGTQAMREVTFVPGYFMLADSRKMGTVLPDMNLPDGNTSVDTTYCVEALARGHRIGIVPHVVYHVRKDGSWVNQAVIEPTNQYHMKRWGQFYFKNAVYCRNVLEWDAPAGTNLDAQFKISLELDGQEREGGQDEQ